MTTPNEKLAEEKEGKRALWLALLALVILAVAFWLMKSGKLSSQSAQPAAPKQEVSHLTPIKNPNPSPVEKVMYTSGAFSPVNLKIKVNTTVIFTSTDQNQFHLTSGLAGFDSAVGVTDYAFTFSQVGTYDYHNADNPPQAGQITVTP